MYIIYIYISFDNAIIFYIFMPIHEDLLLNHQASEHKLSQQRALVMSCWALPIGLRYAAILECTISSFKLLIQQLNAVQNIQNNQRALSLRKPKSSAAKMSKDQITADVESYLVRQHSFVLEKKWQHIDIFDINIAVIELLKDELIHPLSERLRRAAVAGNRFCPRKAASSCPASWSEGPMGPSVTSTLRPRMHGEIPPKIAGSISGLVEGTFFPAIFP